MPSPKEKDHYTYTDYLQEDNAERIELINENIVIWQVVFLAIVQ